MALNELLDERRVNDGSCVGDTNLEMFVVGCVEQHRAVSGEESSADEGREARGLPAVLIEGNAIAALRLGAGARKLDDESTRMHEPNVPQHQHQQQLSHVLPHRCIRQRRFADPAQHY